MNQIITILQLYPSEMNIYGDFGNTLCLKKRLEWRGYEVELKEYHSGEKLPRNVDIVVGGGGQDSGQLKIKDDLVKIAPMLHKMAEDGVPMLMICGLYQLFGRFFKTKEGAMIPGIGIFKAETYGGDKRLVGNIVTKSNQFGEIIGYENHSGLTYLDKDQPGLGRVIQGCGNNEKDKNEGAIYRNVIGTYLHGPLLPKNPKIADFLIKQATKKELSLISTEISSIEKHSRDISRQRPR